MLVKFNMGLFTRCWSVEWFCLVFICLVALIDGVTSIGDQLNITPDADEAETTSSPATDSRLLSTLETTTSVPRDFESTERIVDTSLHFFGIFKNVAISKITIIASDTTEVKLKVIIDEDTFDSLNLDANCSASEGSWTRNYTFLLNSTESEITINKLRPFTNYSCTFVLDGDKTNPYDLSNFQTAEAPPSPPVVTIKDITSISFNVTWSPPNTVATTLSGYVIEITRGNVSSSSHYVTDCFSYPNVTSIVTINRSEPLFYTFESLLPDFQYTVVIFATSSAGDGDNNTSTISTLASKSEEPKNTNFYKLENETYPLDFKQDVVINWEMPCNTNGPVDYFKINLIGEYSLDSNVIDQREYNLSIVKLTTYEYTFEDLMAASQYNFTISAIDSNVDLMGASSIENFTTDENYPSKPDIVGNFSSANSMILSWTPSTNNPGNIELYQVVIRYEHTDWNKTQECNLGTSNIWIYNITELELVTDNILVPSAYYYVTVSAMTSRGIGNASEIEVKTKFAEPEIIRIDQTINTDQNDENDYVVDSVVSFIPGCFNGQFKSYVITFLGLRDNFKDHSDTKVISEYNATTEVRISLRAEYSYDVNVTISNMEFNVTNFTAFTSPPGVPTLTIDSDIQKIKVNSSTTNAVLSLRSSDFNNTQGTMLYLALIVSSENVTGGDFQTWNELEWPETSVDVEIYYQTTPKYWNPFTTEDSIVYVIGDNESCSTEYCNKPLEPGRAYYVFIRMFNSNYYRNSMPIQIITDKLSKLALILGVIFGLLGIAVLGLIAFVLWKKGFLTIANKSIGCQPPSISESEYTPLTKFMPKKLSRSTTAIAILNFLEYCGYLEQNSDALNEQWIDLEVKSVEVYEKLEIHFATLPENKRKNRYTNILPFDHTRVKLNIDEDDEICSDYINASYINGFSKKPEYIATQGPLPGTTRDFWKMVFQEHVTMIVMVAKFVENRRDKCYQYFPNNHESLVFGEDIEVRCSLQLHFQTYCVRILQVRKDEKQLTVTHMQFLEWPDFGTPKDTESLLMFRHQMRKRWMTEGGLAIVHCSAGVGRSGTLIALDILCQAISEGKREIDVFNTVLEMREQRKRMVQTQEQYLYIYQLLKSIIEDPIVDDDENPEHLYENLDSVVNIKDNEVESAL